MSEPTSEDVRLAWIQIGEAAEMFRAIGVTDHRQVESEPGPAGFFTRLAALLAEGTDCPCGREHIPSDHDAELDGPLP